MKIIIDVMSGDNAPLELIKGAVMAVKDFNVDLILTGDKDVINSCAEENNINIDSDHIEIIHTTEVISMDDEPLSVRRKKDSSMSVGLKMLADGLGDAFVGAGNTGALYAGASLIVYRIKGFRKAAIATVLPFEKPVLLVDSGANPNVTDENMEQFALMGSIYMNKIFGIENPAVGLLNNGAEKSKGTQLYQDTYARLSDLDEINFIGNVEGKELPKGVCDVIVTDGFTGNIVLKLIEGLGSFLFGKIKGIFLKNLITKFSAAIIKREFTNFKKQFDASEYGGAPLLGISKPVIKAHGSSDALAVRNAVRQAMNYINTGIIHEYVKLTLKDEKKDNEND